MQLPRLDITPPYEGQMIVEWQMNAIGQINIWVDNVNTILAGEECKCR